MNKLEILKRIQDITLSDDDDFHSDSTHPNPNDITFSATDKTFDHPSSDSSTCNDEEGVEKRRKIAIYGSSYTGYNSKGEKIHTVEDGFFAFRAFLQTKGGSATEQCYGPGCSEFGIADFVKDKKNFAAIMRCGIKGRGKLKDIILDLPYYGVGYADGRYFVTELYNF